MARRIIQDRGTSVIFTTENDFSTYPVAGTILQALLPIRNDIGGAIADTAAYVEEVNRNGTNTYVDAIHQNEIGWAAWAEAIYGVLNPHAQATLNVPISSNRVIKTFLASEDKYFGGQVTFVGGLPLDMSPGAHLLNSPTFANGNYLPGLFQERSLVGVPGTPGVVTNYVTYSHHCWNWANLVFERGVGYAGTAANGYLGQATNSFAGYCTWFDEHGEEHFISSFHYYDDANIVHGPFPRPGMFTLAGITQMLPAMQTLSNSGISQPDTTNRWISGAVRVYITQGNAWVIGVLFGGPDYDDLDLNPKSTAFAQPNPWNWEIPPLDSGLHRWLYFDSLESNTDIRFYGRGMQLMLMANPSGGVLNARGNGALLPDLNLHSPEQSPRILNWSVPDKCNLSQWLDIGLQSLNGFPATPTNGNHRVMLFKASVLK